MPEYKQKITRQMDYPEFIEGINDLPAMHKAFMSLLFFAGCRISEAIALTPEDINCTEEYIFVNFFRLKGSHQTDPQQIPKTNELLWICRQIKEDNFKTKNKIFPFSRFKGDKIVKSAFPELYPHYFRMNRITKTSEKHGDSYVYDTYGISASSIDHYRAKVDSSKVAKALKDEIK